MALTCRPAGPQDAGKIAEIENKVMPTGTYFEATKDEMLDPARGVFFVTEEDGVMTGISHLSYQYGGSGWFEILRVDQDYRNHGAASLMWDNAIRVCAEKGLSSIGMFTGEKNKTSRGIAERHGLALEYEGMQMELKAEDAPDVEDPGFEPQDCPHCAARIAGPYTADYGLFCFNRTFTDFTEDLYADMAAKGFVYTKAGDGEKPDSIVILGNRFTPERGPWAGLMGGDADACARFLAYSLRKSGAPTLFAVVPKGRTDIIQALKKYGFKEPAASLLVLRRHFQPES